MKLVAAIFIFLFIFLFVPQISAARNCVIPAEKQGQYDQCVRDGILTPDQCNGLFRTKCTTVSETESVFGQIQVPDAIKNIGLGKEGVDNVLSVGINLAFVIGTFLCLAFVIWGAIDIITSGANKEGMAGGQKKITFALIGLTILGLSFVIVRVVAGIVGLGGILRF